MTKKDSRAAWTKPITRAEWKGFLNHNFSGPDRTAAYDTLKRYVNDNHEKAPFSFMEIGFGQCYDFHNCFKALQQDEHIRYHGLDITEQFVKYAAEEYQGYDFQCGGFDDLAGKQFDITYTAKTLEHQHPDDYERCLRNLLEATGRLCVIIWFKAPAEKEQMYWCDRDGFGHEGAWGNTYSKQKIADIVKDCGFSLRDIPVVGARHVYVMERSRSCE